MHLSPQRYLRHSSLIATLVLLLGGCTEGNETPVRSATELRVIKDVQALSFERISSALDALESTPYVANVHLVELSINDGREIGRQSYSGTADGRAGLVIDSTSVDVADGSTTVVDPLDDETLLSSGPQLPFDLPPDFASDRQVHLFDYSEGDTLVDGESLKLYRIVRRDSSPSAKSETILLVERNSNEVVEIIDESHNRAFLFAADNIVHLKLEQLGSAWMPADYEFDLRIKSPLRPARHFQVNKSYSYGTSDPNTSEERLD